MKLAARIAIARKAMILGLARAVATVVRFASKVPAHCRGAIADAAEVTSAIFFVFTHLSFAAAKFLTKNYSNVAVTVAAVAAVFAAYFTYVQSQGGRAEIAVIARDIVHWPKEHRFTAFVPLTITNHGAKAVTVDLFLPYMSQQVFSPVDEPSLKEQPPKLTGFDDISVYFLDGTEVDYEGMNQQKQIPGKKVTLPYAPKLLLEPGRSSVHVLYVDAKASKGDSFAGRLFSISFTMRFSNGQQHDFLKLVRYGKDV